jgi:hypothetical protein
MTTTVASATGGPVDRDRHAGLDQCRAGAQTATIGETDPAILTGRHQAEAGTMGFAELEAAQDRAMQQDRRQKQIAFASFGRRAIDGEWDRRTVAWNEAPEQSGLR